MLLKYIKLTLHWFAFSKESQIFLSEGHPLPLLYWALVMLSKGTVSINDTPTSNQIVVSRLLLPPNFL